YTAALGRSPRVTRDAELIRFGQDRAHIRAAVQGERPQVLEVAFDRATGERRLRVNGVVVDRGQLLGRLMVVMAGPLDDEVIRGAPEYRRRVMDAALSQVSPSYFFALTRYTRVVRQRNRLLRAGADGAALAPWDEQLVDLGAVLIERRREFVARLGERAAARHARLAGGDERLQISYVCAVGEGEERAALARALAARRQDGLRRGPSLGAPRSWRFLYGSSACAPAASSRNPVFRLKDLLGDALGALVGPRRARQAGVLEAWPEIVGEAHARHAWAAGIRGNALIVVTDLP